MGGLKVPAETLDYDSINPISPAKQTFCSCGEKTSFGCNEMCRYCFYKAKFEAIPIESHLQAAGVPPKLARRTSKRYVESFLNKNAPLHADMVDNFNTSAFLTGDPGSGKTTLAVAAMIYHMRQWATTKEHFAKGRTFLFVTIPEMIQDIRFSFKLPYEEEVEIFSKYKNVDFLVLDDFGVEKTTDWAFSVLYLIINHRYEYDKQTIFTSNFSLDQIAEKNNDERITRRISEWASIIELAV